MMGWKGAPCFGMTQPTYSIFVTSRLLVGRAEALEPALHVRLALGLVGGGRGAAFVEPALERVPLVGPQHLRPERAAVRVERLVGAHERPLRRARGALEQLADERVGVLAGRRDAQRQRAQLLARHLGTQRVTVEDQRGLD